MQSFALGVMLTVADPATGVNAGIAVTPVWLTSPIAAPPEISKTTPDGVPASVMAVVATPLQ